MSWPTNKPKKTTLVLLIFVFLDNYVHRLVASKTDGKIVQYECEGDTCDAEKIDALQLEVNIFLIALLLWPTQEWSDQLSVPAVLVPAYKSAGVSKDLLGE